MSNYSFEPIEDSKQWDNLIQQSGQTFQHFKQWANVKSATWSFKQYKVGDYPIQVAIKKGLKGLLKLGYLAPLTTNGLNEKVFKAIYQFSKQKSFDTLIVETHTTDKKYIELMQKAGFKKYFTEVQPRNTNTLDLTLSEDELFANLKGKYRREIRKAIKNNIVVTTYTSGTKAVEQFYEIISAVVGRGKFTTYKKEYFQTMFDNFKGNSEIHIIHEKNTPNIALGAYLVLYDTATAYELYGGTNYDGRKKRVGFLLKWASIQSALKRNITTYDQWGVAPRDKNDEYITTDHLYNISIFKKGFGGKDITFIPAMVIVNSSIKYKLYQIAMAIKPIFLKLLKFIKK